MDTHSNCTNKILNGQIKLMKIYSTAHSHWKTQYTCLDNSSQSPSSSTKLHIAALFCFRHFVSARLGQIDSG